jgi:hypothetical protein
MRGISPWGLAAWTGATAIATVVSWAGVGVVTRDVTASPQAILTPSHIISDVRAAAPPTPVETPTTGVPGSSGGVGSNTPPVASSGPSTGTTPPADTTGTTPSGSTTVTTVPANTDTSSNTSAGSAVSSTPTTTTTVPLAPMAATYSTQGGQVTVLCRAQVISLQSAVPASGYEVTVGQDGPQIVGVAFTSDSTQTQYRLFADCDDEGQPFAITPAPTSGSGPPGSTTPPSGTSPSGSGSGGPGRGSHTSPPATTTTSTAPKGY